MSFYKSLIDLNKNLYDVFHDVECNNLIKTTGLFSSFSGNIMRIIF